MLKLSPTDRALSGHIGLTASRPAESDLLAQQLISQRGMNRSPAEAVG
jgi:hypothetical protein